MATWRPAREMYSLNMVPASAPSLAARCTRNHLTRGHVGVECLVQRRAHLLEGVLADGGDQSGPIPEMSVEDRLGHPRLGRHPIHRCPRSVTSDHRESRLDQCGPAGIPLDLPIRLTAGGRP
jgi:hypothetical protein